ncbi:hypothetical protein [Rhodopseudomonas pseudopalustris]|uniref:Gp49 pectin lyase-like domain-containing protein n=1 Tax=Rhodopseudomonas pseudopalustris TaxID=1513892 RepID=A0A1H8WI61_9BRAD|nr:hypothetical protein [Rhodopseudomonas pseudopalustris]SEP27350.1 hypothetical protein SAMN05444123_112116 [Rhodopseudomonas pseudopalustris]
MPYPRLYSPSYSYTDFSAAQGDSGFPGTRIDADLAGLSQTIANVAAFMQGVIRSDGALNNGVVTYDSLAPSLQTAGLIPADGWAPGVNFAAGQPAVVNDGLYRSRALHTASANFAADLAAGLWQFVFALPLGPVGPKGDVGATGPKGDTGAIGPVGASYAATSSTSLTIEPGVKTVTTQAGLAYVYGSRVRLTPAAGAANYMEGICTEYIGPSMTINVTRFAGSGTFAAWTISLAGDPGSGDMFSAANLSDLANYTIARNNLGVGAIVNGRTELAGLPASVMTYRSAELMEAGREGRFKWVGQNLASKVASDLSQGLYVAPSFDPTGASGAWVRVFSGPAIATWWGVDPTGVVDAGGLISRIFGTADVKWLRFPAGLYRIDTSPDPRTTSIVITGDGKGITVLNFSNAAARFQFNGSISALPTLSSYMRTERDYAAFSSAHSLAPNDLFLAFKPGANSFFDSNRPGQARNYTQAEFFTVANVTNATDVKIFGRPSDLYTPSDTAMYKVNPISFSMSDLTITGGAVEAIVYVLWARGVDIRNVELKAKDYSAIEIDRCFDGKLSGVSCSNSSTSGGMYGVSLNSCTNFTYDGGSPAAGRHAIALGQREEVGAGPNRYIWIVNTRLSNASNGIGAADMHGSVESIFYDNCVLDGGLVLAGKNVSARNSIIRQMPGDTNGSAVYGSEFLGGTFTLENIKFIVHYGNLAYGLIRLSPGNTLKQKCNFIFRNITIDSQLGYDDTVSTSRLIYVGARSANMAVNVVVDGLIANVSSLDAVIYAHDEELSTLNSDYLVADNVTLKCGGSRNCIAATSDIAAVKTRQQGTTGTGGGLALTWPN